jgi:hypothetical protein
MIYFLSEIFLIYEFSTAPLSAAYYFTALSKCIYQPSKLANHFLILMNPLDL